MHSMRGMAIAILLCSCMPFAWASGIAVNKAELRAGEQGFRPVANFVITPSSMVKQALTHGVSLYFVSEFKLVYPRWYWLDKTVADDVQTAKLFYNALTRQYRIAYGSLYLNFSSLNDALQVLSHQLFAPIQMSALKPGDKYVASVRLHLDFSQLPKPLQINALVNTGWELDSGWYSWDVDTNVHRKQKESKGSKP
jgi:hypothetical protein